eukprot:12418456-Karenia_brevis.AAC.1
MMMTMMEGDADDDADDEGDDDDDEFQDDDNESAMAHSSPEGCKKAATISLRDSPTAKHDYLAYLRGSLSANELARKARRALQEYGSERLSEANRSFAKLGTGANVERNLLRLRISPAECIPLPEPWFFDLPVKSRDRLGFRMSRHPMFLPHEWLASLKRDEFCFKL